MPHSSARVACLMPGVTRVLLRVAPVDAERLPVCRRHKEFTRGRQSQKTRRVEKSPAGMQIPDGKESSPTTSRGFPLPGSRCAPIRASPRIVTPIAKRLAICPAGRASESRIQPCHINSTKQKSPGPTNGSGLFLWHLRTRVICFPPVLSVSTRSFRRESL